MNKLVLIPSEKFNRMQKHMNECKRTLLEAFPSTEDSALIKNKEQSESGTEDALLPAVDHQGSAADDNPSREALTVSLADRKRADANTDREIIFPSDRKTDGFSSDYGKWVAPMPLKRKKVKRLPWISLD